MICPNCKTENHDGAKFCRSCGKSLATHNKAWWKEYNMEPVRVVGFRRGCFVKLLRIVLFFILWLTIYGCSGMSIKMLFFSNLYLNGNMIFLTMASAVIISTIICGFIYVRVKRKDLLDSDYIQTYEKEDARYVFIARGTSGSHKFGLFDVQNKKIKLLPVYDELRWLEIGKLLSALKDGERIVIDCNGHIYS